MSAAERRQLARALAAIDYPRPMLGLYLSRRRRVGVIFSIISCVALACWIVVLVLSLHRSFHAHHWRAAAAVFVELPLAFLMFNAGRRLIRISAHAAMSESGNPPQAAANHRPVPIWKIPLAGVEVATREQRAGHKGETTDRSGEEFHRKRW